MMRQSVLSALRSVLGPTPGIAVVHSSISSLAPPPGFDRWEVLYAIGTLANEGWTIALPAFTFSFCGGKPYDHRETRSEVGILADWALESLSTARRTAHPIYSFVVVGPQADRILACESETTFGLGSPFELFEAENAVVVMLGCGWKYCTQFHRYEELAAVPYRYNKSFVGQADFGGGEGRRETAACMYVRDLGIDPQNDFMPAVEALRQQGLIRTAPLWRGVVEAVATRDLAETCQALLRKDALAFVANAPDVAHKLARKAEASRQKPLRIAVLGQANVDLLRGALEREIAALLGPLPVDIRTVPYGQMQQQILDRGSELAAFKAGVTFFCDRLEDLLGVYTIDDAAADKVLDRVANYCDLVQAQHEANGGWSIVHTFANLARSSRGGGSAHLSALAERANAILRERLGEIEQLVLFDLGREAALSGVKAVDARLWHLGRFPFSEPFARHLAGRWAALVAAASGKTARVIVLDLDNTLWGGVLGEDGLSGVKIGGDYPGNGYATLQRALKLVSARGIALAIASKNDEDLALKALDTIPAMELRSEDIVAHRINWRPKAQNIREICEELSLGLESVLFVDDNPVERESVKRILPGVKVLDLPTDPAGYAEALLASPWLESLAVTKEDRKRVKSYKQRAQFEHGRRNAVSLEDFFASLGMKLHCNALDDGNAARAAQLCQKTNQFNTTTRRYDQRELREIVREGGDVVVLGLEDKFSEFENIGLLILKAHPERAGFGLVDVFLMSCRVLGRGLETAILHWALRRARARGWKGLAGAIVETERNTPVRGVYRDAGFAYDDQASEWTKAAAEAPAAPTWLTLVENMPELAMT